ncbi:MAG TPA: galactose-1-phosphate uridylyltransferase, partial [Nitrospirae bacterium]|nr:galactose-1-phosphate uridylyltransferase [Nitrospirota bacterium]
MPELRRDPIVGRWVIIATERGKRPSDFKMRVPAKKAGFCAFCNG